ncbi:MAG TPA: HNH endonuclease [Stellaceae bacterium]|nr:HNH endonuclease [Stellaceae bacterium]
MTIRVYKVGEVVGGKVVFQTNQKFRAGDLAAVLTNLREVDDPLRHTWTFDLVVGAGPAARTVQIDLPPFLPRSQHEAPFFPPEASGRIVYFHDRLFMPERSPSNTVEQEEVILRVKKAVYEEEAELSSLREAVANLEAAIEFQKSGPKRDVIPEDVKLVVWARDGGACMRCGSKQDLHFDHIIPVAKGGGNSAANIQILCEACNLRKGDKIAIT